MKTETETEFRNRTRYEQERKRNLEHGEASKKAAAERLAGEQAQARRMAEAAKAAIGIDKSTVAGLMAATSFEERADSFMEYQRLAKRVAQAGDAAKPADKSALAKSALGLGYAPARVEADLAKLRRYFDRRPRLDALIAGRAEAERKAADAVAKHKAAEGAVKATLAQQADAVNQANKTASAPSELQSLEATCGELFMTREQLVERWTREQHRQDAAIRRQTPGVAFAV